MAYGLEVKNPLGYTQVTDEYSNLQIVNVQYVSTSYTSGSTFSYYLCNVSPGDLLFVNISDLDVHVLGIYCYSIYNTNFKVVCSGTGSKNLQLITCRKASNLPIPSGYGLNVLKSDGTLAFSSAYNNVQIQTGTYLNNSLFYYNSSNSYFISLPALQANYKRCYLINHLPIVSTTDVYSEHGIPPSICWVPAALYGSSGVYISSKPDRSYYEDFSYNYSGSFCLVIGDIII